MHKILEMKFKYFDQESIHNLEPLFNEKYVLGLVD